MTKSLCNYCTQIVSCSGGSTGNLRRHLKAKHPGVICRISGKGKKGEKLDFGEDSSPHTAHAEIHHTTSASESELKMLRLLSIANECAKMNKPVSVNKALQFDIQLVKMVVKEFHQFGLVEEVEFKKFVHMLCPGYTLPTKKVLSENLIQLYTSTVELVRKKIKDASYVCLSVESWVSANGGNFVAITAHFVDSNFTQRGYFLRCAEFSDENLSEIFKSTIQEWCLENKIAAVVSDNIPTIVKSIDSCGWKHLQCFAHTIDQIVTNGIFIIKTIVNKIKSVVEYFKRNPDAQAKLSDMQKQMGLPDVKLKIDVATHWNSTYNMMERILLIKDAVVTTIALLHKDSTVAPLTPEEWNVAEKSRDILNIFHHVTTELSTERYVSISKVIIMVQSIRRHISRFSKDMKLPRLCESMLSILNVQLLDKFRKIEDIELITQPMFLDPRFKKYGFSDQEKFVETYNSIKNSDNDNPDPTTDPLELSDNEKSELQYDDLQKEKSSTVLWGDFDDRIKNAMYLQIPSAAIIKEMDRYLQEPVVKRTEDPLRWWSERAGLYPRLVELVKKRLCIVAASVPCDRIFSKAGQVLLEKRNRLSSSKANKILFLHSNME